MYDKEDVYRFERTNLSQVLLNKLWIIVLIGVIFAAFGFTYSTVIAKPVYQARVLMYVNESTSNLDSSIYEANDKNAKLVTDTYITILKTKGTMESVIEKANLTYSYQELSDMISGSQVNNTKVFAVNVNDFDPVEAARIANAVAEVLPEKISSVIAGTSTRVVDYATVPEERYSPSAELWTVISGLVGLAIGFLAIILENIFADVVKSYNDLNSYDVATLGIVPCHNERDEKGLCSKMSPDVHDAYELLTNNLLISASNDSKCKVFGVTGPNSKEGKTNLAINLAYTISQLDKKVLLIECDLRHPSIKEKLNVNLFNSYGLSDLVLGRCTKQLSVIPSPVSRNLDLLLQGTCPSEALDALSSSQMKGVLASLSLYYNYIVINLPDTSSCDDAIVVHDSISGYVINVKERQTPKNSIAKCLTLLKEVDAKFAGFVLTNSSDSIEDLPLQEEKL